jgi:hypothetical protein
MTITKTVVFTKDLSSLTDAEKTERYLKLCQGFNLNPNAYPFKLMRVNGKEVLACGAELAQRLVSRYYDLHKAPNAKPTQQPFNQQ